MLAVDEAGASFFEAPVAVRVMREGLLVGDHGRLGVIRNERAAARRQRQRPRRGDPVTDVDDCVEDLLRQLGALGPLRGLDHVGARLEADHRVAVGRAGRHHRFQPRRAVGPPPRADLRQRHCPDPDRDRGSDAMRVRELQRAAGVLRACVDLAAHGRDPCQNADEVREEVVLSRVTREPLTLGCVRPGGRIGTLPRLKQRDRHENPRQQRDAAEVPGSGQRPGEELPCRTVVSREHRRHAREMQLLRVSGIQTVNR
jgi:hypothetical protein